MQQHGPLPLDQLQEQLIRDGQQQFSNPVDFAATFISHDLEWLPEWEALQQQDVPDLKPNATGWRWCRNACAGK